MRSKVAFLGGTFNPVHFGHLRLALDLVQRLGLERVSLLPCHIPTHRQTPSVDSNTRAAMVSLAIESSAELSLDKRELERGTASYSIDTLQELRSEIGTAPSLSLVLGLDAYIGLPGWKAWQQLLDYCHLLVVDRPGYRLPQEGPLAEFDKAYRGAPACLDNYPAGKVVHMCLRSLDISATEIRELTAAGRSTRYLLPESVRHFIHQQGLYSSGLKHSD